MISFLNANNSDKFIICGSSDVSLYELKEKSNDTDFIYDCPKVHNTNNLKFISQVDSSVSYLNTEKRYQYIKCVAPSHHQDELLVACGQASGKVSIIDFNPTSDNYLEFTPRQNRPCLAVSWNVQEPSLLSMGFEKNKFDHGITVWDVGKGGPSESSIVHLIGLSETAHSMCWDKKTLIAGMSQKHIKLFDLRQSPTVSMTNTRAVNGLSISPNSRYLASYFENVVNLFDLRKFSEPINHFQVQNNLAQISWCPTMSNYLMCLQKDSSRTMNIVDIHLTGTDGDNDGAHFVKRTVAPFEIVDRKNRLQLAGKNTILDGICWNPKKSNQMMALANTNNSLLLMELQVPDRTIAIFDKWNKLWGPTANEIREIPLISPPSTPTDSTNYWFANGGLMDGDLAELFQQRIMQDYGQFNELEKNAKTCMDPSLQRVWRLLGQMQKADCFIGLRTILGIVPNSDELTIAQSSAESRSFSDFPTIGNIRVYRSEERDFAQELCGWGFHKGDLATNLIGFNDELCQKKKFTRAAMLAVFHLRIRMAIDVLGRGANDMSDDDKSALRMSAIALAGFSSGVIWKTQCAAAQKQIQDPHLRAIFNFLADETYAGVLYENGISISDRMAFACAYLNDRQLSEYVKFMILHSIEEGDLNGLLVTGATLDGIQLLQAFVDRTDDVQTAALIGAKIMPPDLQTDNRIQSWILSLRDMMNRWQMWEKRAAFDISIQLSMKTSPKTPKSVYLLCSFCGKSVSATLQEDARQRNQTQGNKLSACPNCRKPLPRCSLCLLHMGTTTTSYNPGGIKSKPFQKWFSWCQTCRHGGHVTHLAEWFKTHTECPVTCCNCKCFAIDLPLLKESDKTLDADDLSGKVH